MKKVKTFRVEALEKFVVRTVYYVPADDAHHAEQICKAGAAGYDEKEIEEGDEEWLETVDISEVEPGSDNYFEDDEEDEGD
jgi:hypothetical protein